MLNELVTTPRPAAGGCRFCLLMQTMEENLPKICVLNHECYHCGFDQWLDHAAEAQVVHGRTP